MVRISKQEERRAKSPRKPKALKLKTTTEKKRAKLKLKKHANALTGKAAKQAFIPKIS